MKIHLPLAWLAGVLALVVLALPAQGAIQGRIDPQQTELVAVLRKAGPAAFLAHDHVIEAQQVAGQVDWNREDPSASRIVVAVETDSLVPDEPPLRHRYGLKGQPSEKDRAKIRATLQSQEQLYVRRYPQITFRTVRIRPGEEGQGHYEATGEFTLRGATRTLAVPLTVQVNQQQWVAEGQFTIRQSDFGYEPYSAAVGAIRNADPVSIYVHLVVSRSSEPRLARLAEAGGRSVGRPGAGR